MRSEIPSILQDKECKRENSQTSHNYSVYKRHKIDLDKVVHLALPNEEGTEIPFADSCHALCKTEVDTCSLQCVESSEYLPYI